MSLDPKPGAKYPGAAPPHLAPIVSRGGFPTPGPIWRPQLPPPAESLGHFFLKVPRWGTAGAYRRRPRRATDGRPSKCPAAWGDVGRRGLPSCTLGSGWVKGKKSHRRLRVFCTRSLRPLSAVRLCAQRAAGGAALREQRERKPSEKSGEIAADRVNFLACGALNWLACGALNSACGAFRSACGAKRTRPKSQACGSSLLTCLLTRPGSGLRANGSKQIHLLLFSSTLRSSCVRSCFLLVVTRTEL